MASNVIYNVLVDFSKGFELGSADVTDTVATALSLPNLVNKTPVRWMAGMGVTYIFNLYTNLAENVKPDCSSMTATLYGRLLSSASAKVTLDVGAISGTSNNIATFSIDKDTIPEAWSRGDVVRMSIEITNGAGQEQIDFYQDVNVVSIDQFDDTTPTTEDFDIDTIVIANATTTPDVQPGLRYVTLDGTLGAATLTLPTAPGFDGQTFEVLCINSTNTCTIGGNGSTINGASSLTMILNDSATIVENDSNWLLMNPSVGVS